MQLQLPSTKFPPFQTFGVNFPDCSKSNKRGNNGRLTAQMTNIQRICYLVSSASLTHDAGIVSFKAKHCSTNHELFKFVSFGLNKIYFIYHNTLTTEQLGLPVSKITYISTASSFTSHTDKESQAPMTFNRFWRIRGAVWVKFDHAIKALNSIWPLLYTKAHTQLCLSLCSSHTQDDNSHDNAEKVREKNKCK